MCEKQFDNCVTRGLWRQTYECPKGKLRLHIGSVVHVLCEIFVGEILENQTLVNSGPFNELGSQKKFNSL
jgi:hypothetical protein